MSELKAYTSNRIYWAVDERPADKEDALLVGEKFYLKYEADKVIAELKAQKEQAEDDCAYWKMSEGNAVNATHETEEYAMQLYKELRHQKYKRCVAMAQEWRSYAAFCGIQSSWHNNRGFGKTAEKYTWKECHAWRCVKRWLELAEKFKEAK